MKCHLCHWERAHDKDCPESAPSSLRGSWLASWRRGYNHGREGQEAPLSDNATYHLGWLQGISALEEAQNGHDPRWDE